MSAEHFSTDLSIDIRTTPDGQVEYAKPFTGEPRRIANGQWSDDPHAWAAVHPYAENVIRFAAQAVLDQPTDGISGDLQQQREEVASQLAVLADKVCLLALDAAQDSHFTGKAWNDLNERLAATTAVSPTPEH